MRANRCSSGPVLSTRTCGLTSTSSAGASVITLQFSLDLSLDVAEQQVQAAINAAVNDALAPLGVRLTELPMTPERLLSALRDAGQAG